MSGAEIRGFGPLLGGGAEAVSGPAIGTASKVFSSSFYRGENCNFSANLDDFACPDFVENYVLKGWLPSIPFITATTRITTFGSCFALNIAKHLGARGYNLSHQRSPAIYISQMAEGLVNCHALLQQFEWALEGAVPPAGLWHGYKAEEYGYDPRIQKETREVLLNTDFFVITLGLSEIWYDTLTNGVLWRAVPLRHFNPDRHRFRVCSLAETKAALQRIVELVGKYIPHAKVLFTLSPIPLAATFRPSSCLTANAASKAILRAALDEMLREREAELNLKLFYFPSYEIVTELFFNRFGPDLRHPPDYILDIAMRAFDAAYCVGEPTLSAISALLQASRVKNAEETIWATGCSDGFSLFADDARLRTLVGKRCGRLIVIEPGAHGVGLFGPYVDLPSGHYTARIEFQWDRPLAGNATIDVCSGRDSLLGQLNVTSATIKNAGMAAEITFSTSSPAPKVQIRLYFAAGFVGSIRRVEVRPALQLGSIIEAG